MSKLRLYRLIIVGCCSISLLSVTNVNAQDPVGRDSVLDWNAIALQAVVDDHSGTFGDPEQGGPTRTSRALGIVHAAMFDALNSIETTAEVYRFFQAPGGNASIDAAVAQAAHDTLKALYPNQKDVFKDALQDYLVDIPNMAAFKARGRNVGRTIARKLLMLRKNDGSNDPMSHDEGFFPGEHRQDPLNPTQGFLTPQWGDVDTFAIPFPQLFQVAAPPDLTSPAYTAAYNEVKDFGGDGVITPTIRTPEQTEIGLFWAYDGSNLIGVPPRLYNQITRVVAIQEGNTEVENARLFALVNLAMADAGIVSWHTKYIYDFWRPIIGIRESDPGTGPSGLGDGNPDTVGDTGWTPLGAPASNTVGGSDFSPPFPAYSSGHATFGAAMFRILENFYGTDDIAFTFTSDELNGVTTDSQGNVRPLSPRSFNSFSEGADENALSRIFLGIHWIFDATSGVEQGTGVADEIFSNNLELIGP